MDQQKRERLCKAGIDVDGALARFMNNEALLLKFLFRFPADPNFAALEQALEQGNTEQAFTAAHTLKGVAGNLSLEELHRQVSLQVEDLRVGNLAQAREKMPQVCQAYEAVLSALEG